MKQMTVEEWEAIGKQSKKARNELMLLLSQTSGQLPIHTTNALRKSVQCLDRFRSQAEDRMMNTGASDDVRIFYGNN